MNKFNVNLNLYRSFYYVAKYEGFTRASFYANISQSSLSSNIKKLESELDTLLFNRVGTNIKLTQNGKDLYDKLIEIVSILDTDKVLEKEINIGCIRFIADNYLSDAIIEFKSKFKDIKLNLSILYNADLYKMLKKDLIDVVICRYPFYKFDNDIVIEKIFEAENVFACSKKYYEKEYKKFNNENYIYSLILPDSSEKRRNIEQCLIDNNIKYKVSIELPNSNLLKTLIKSDLGIGYINKKFIESDVSKGDVIILDNFKNLPIDNITIMYNKKKINNITKDFIDVIKKNIKTI